MPSHNKNDMICLIYGLRARSPHILLTPCQHSCARTDINLHPKHNQHHNKNPTMSTCVSKYQSQSHKHTIHTWPDILKHRSIKSTQDAPHPNRCHRARRLRNPQPHPLSPSWRSIPPVHPQQKSCADGRREAQRDRDRA